jgi:type I restriction enzyme R subunit
VHRSYNPQGSFLANLSESDRNAIKIGLTGTPLLGDDYNSRALFGDGRCIAPAKAAELFHESS